MKQGVVFFASVAVIFALAGCYEVSLWRDCLSDHHFWYCLRSISR